MICIMNVNVTSWLLFQKASCQLHISRIFKNPSTKISCCAINLVEAVGVKKLLRIVNGWYRSDFLTACSFHRVRSTLFQPCCKYMSGWIVKRFFITTALCGYILCSQEVNPNGRTYKATFLTLLLVCCLMSIPSSVYYVEYVALWLSNVWPASQWQCPSSWI